LLNTADKDTQFLFFTNAADQQQGGRAENGWGSYTAVREKKGK
jgi:hypothetical protein